MIALAAIGLLVLLAGLDRLGAWWLNRDARATAEAFFGRSPGKVAVRERLILIRPDMREDSPIALVLHGWGIMHPTAYAGLIEATVAAGYTVAFPLYQTRFFPHRVVDEVRGLLDRNLPLWRDGTELIVGHSAGASTAVDLLVEEGSRLAPRAVFLLSPGDGSDPQGHVLADFLRLHWDEHTSPLPSLPNPRPVVVVLSGARDTVSGQWVAGRIASYLRTLDPAWPVSQGVIADLHACDTHFWPLGGDSDYRLPWLTQLFTHSSPFGDCAPGWPLDRIDRAFWQRMFTLASPRVVAAAATP